MNRVVKVALAGLTGAAAGLAGSLIPALRRVTPEERERRRRAAVNARGRLGAAVIVDVRDGVVVYSYSIAGVKYSSGQDVSDLCDLLPDAPERLIGRPAALKYLARNPENSIILCEQWSGMQRKPQTTGNN